ncbi:transposase [Kitasatospora sp. NPDC005751]|uniref:transposase n=1 Tax=unclassified Kitasatospora TaxID=2633591 RepID=UPI0033D569BF
MSATLISCDGTTQVSLGPEGRSGGSSSSRCWWSGDAAALKASPNTPADSQGYDGGKRVEGRKRHIATDTLGLLLVLIVTAAGVQDSAGGKQVLDTLAGQ